MHTIYSLILAFFSVTLLVGCSNETGNTDSSNLDGINVEIENIQEAQNAIDSITSITNISSSPTSYLSSKNAPYRTAYNSNCTYGGSFTSDIDNDGNFIATYTQCKEYGYTIDGQMNGINSYDDINDIIRQDASFSNFTYMSSDTNITLNFSTNIITNYNYDPIDTTMNGSILFSSTKFGSGVMGYENFRVIEDTTQSLLGTIDISGKVSIDSTINVCSNGTYDLETLEILTPDYTGGFSAGTLKVNGAVFVFDGINAKVTYPDGSTDIIDQTQPVVCN